MTERETRLAHARRMRRQPVVMERRLWNLVRDRQLEGMKFRRQVPIGPYVADFVSFRHRLIVEADGPHHDPAKDAIRDAWLTGEGFRVLRFENAEIENRPHLVLARIVAAAANG